MSSRTRLSDDERLYLISLVETDNNLSGNQAKDALIGKPIKRLLAKLGDTRYHEEKLRTIELTEVECPHCERVVKSGAGLSRHISHAHKAQLSTTNKDDTTDVKKESQDE